MSTIRVNIEGKDYWPKIEGELTSPRLVSPGA